MNCPTCSEDFEDGRSMKIHHKLSHGDSIALEESNCRECGETFNFYPSDKDGVYCSDCVADPNVTWSNGGLSVEAHPRFGIEPEEHPMWSGGYNIKYIGVWNQVRRQRLRIDGHSCQRCGADRDELGQEPDVHHIKPVRDFEDERDAHSVENTICLCRSCHGVVENNS